MISPIAKKIAAENTGLGARFHTRRTGETEEVRHSQPLDLDLLPDFVAHRAAFQLDRLVGLTCKVLKNSSRSNCTNGQLFEKTFVSLE